MDDTWSLNGYYDERGHWQRTKFCFMSCGHRCDCGPPGGLWYSAAHDKSKHPQPVGPYPGTGSPSDYFNGA